MREPLTLVKGCSAAKTIKDRCKCSPCDGWFQSEPLTRSGAPHEPYMKTAEVKTDFDAIEPDLIALVKAISTKSGTVSSEVLHSAYDEQKQWNFGPDAIKRY
jgi:hypothetical protein